MPQRYAASPGERVQLLERDRPAPELPGLLTERPALVAEELVQTTDPLDIFTMNAEAFGHVIANVVSLPSAKLGMAALRFRRLADCYAASPRIEELAQAASDELARRAREEPGVQLEIAQHWPGIEQRERI